MTEPQKPLSFFLRSTLFLSDTEKDSNDNAVTYTKTTETKTVETKATELKAAEVNAARNMSRIGG